MAIADPIGKARAVSTPLQAARLMARLEHEISFDESASEEWHQSADKAIDGLRARFPSARTLDAYMQPPAGSPAARAGIRVRKATRRRGWARRAGVLALLAAVVAIIWRLARRRAARRVLPIVAAGSILGWRAGAAVAFASAMVAALQRVRRAAHIGSR